MRALGAVAFGFVKSRDRRQIDRMRRLNGIQHLLHPVVERLGPENLVVLAAVHDEGGDMSGHGRPVDIRVHRAAPADRVACEQEEPAKAGDLIEFLLAVLAAHFDPVFLDQHRHQIAAIAFAVALDAADLVKEGGQDAGIGVAHAGERIGFVPAHVVGDQRLAVLDGPFMHTPGGIMNVAIEKFAMIGIIHDLSDGRTGAFGDDAIDDAFAFGHPGSGKAHILPPLACGRRVPVLPCSVKKANNVCLFNACSPLNG